MSGGALIEGPYRYWLWRHWGGGGRVCFVMLNPSTADAEDDDPTIRRCIGFAQAVGAGALEVVNLFAFRATDWRELERAADPVGPENDAHIENAARAASMVICAWGARPFAKARARKVFKLLLALHVQPLCLRHTLDGSPHHPLRLPACLRPQPFAPPRLIT